MSDKLKIIVTGGCGYIGSHTVVELAEAGFEPVIVDNLVNSREEVIDGIEKIIGWRPAFYKVDCTDEEALSNVIRDQGQVDGLIHFAAYKSVGESVREPLKYYQNNLGSMVTVLDVLTAAGVEKLVFSSSCSVYGNPDSLPVTEESPIKPAESPYGYTKQICERMIFDHAATGAGLKSMVLRYFNPIGAHPSAMIGELPIGTPENLVPYVTQTAAGIREELVVFGDDYDTPDGTCIRDYIHVVDLAAAHVSALRALDNSGDQVRVYNLGTGAGSSVMEVIKGFEEATGVSVAYTIGERRAGDVVQIYANAEKSNRDLNWKAEKSLQDALADAWRWEQKLTKESSSAS